MRGACRAAPTARRGRAGAVENAVRSGWPGGRLLARFCDSPSRARVDYSGPSNPHGLTSHARRPRRSLGLTLSPGPDRPRARLLGPGRQTGSDRA